MLQPKHQHYRVKRGDTLSGIAQREYGAANVWPEIARQNNLPNGDFIVVGLNLRLGPLQGPTAQSQPRLAPSFAASSVKAPPSPPVHSSRPFGTHGIKQNNSIAPAARPVLFPAVKYSFEKMPEVAIVLPKVEYKVKLTGDMTIQQKGTMTEVEFGKTVSLSGKLKSEYDSKFSKLASQVKVKWSPGSPAEVSCGFTIAAKIDGKTFVTHEYKIVPPNKFKYTLTPKEIEGERDGVLFKGSIGYELEITVRDDTQPRPQLIPITQGVRVDEVAWVVVGGLVVAGVAIIVLDIAKDVATLGVGVVESPLSFAAATALFSRAAVMIH
jgi:hypothetical protein